MANFDHVARWYLPAERLALGWWLERTREFFLPEVAACREAVLLGDGDGRFTARLLARAPDLHATAVDSSAAMLRLLKRRSERVTGSDLPNRLTLAQADARRWTPDTAPDLVVTHFFLDCLETAEVAVLAQRVGENARPGCLWLLSDFAAPRRQPWRAFGAAYIRALYLGFGLATGLRVRRLPAMREALRAAGFVELQRREFLGGLLFTSLWQMAEHATRAAGQTIHSEMSADPNQKTPDPDSTVAAEVQDAVPDPEPAAPSLREPDPGIFKDEPRA